MNTTTLNKIIESGYLKNSTPIARLIDYFVSIYQDEFEPHEVFGKFTSLINACPDYSGEVNVNSLNHSLKIYIYLSKQIGDVWENENNSSDATDEFIGLVADELVNPQMIQKKEYSFLLILLYYTLQMEDKDFSSALRKSQLADWIHGFIPSILSQELNAGSFMPASVVKSVLSRYNLPLYVRDHLTKGFFVPRGYRLEISHDGEPGRTVEPGEYSGSNYTFEDIMNNVHPDWNLVQTGSSVDDNYNTNPQNPATQMYSDTNEFSQGGNFVVASAYHATLHGLVNYPEEIVVEDIKQRLGVSNAQQLLHSYVADHPSIDISQVKTIAGIKKNGDIYLNFYLEDEDGDNLFEMERTVSEDGLSAYHESFYIVEELQGKGIGKAFYDAQENFYKRIGVQSIELHANSDVGGYAWAKLGYEFKDPDYASFVRNRGFVKLVSLKESGTISSSDFDSIWDTLLKCVSVEDFLNVTYPSNDERVKSFGKTILLGSSWHGVKRLWKGN